MVPPRIVRGSCGQAGGLLSLARGAARGGVGCMITASARKGAESTRERAQVLIKG
jgi:hypothetical protein